MLIAERQFQPLRIRPVKSRAPLPETLRSLLAMQGISQNELVRRCQAKGWGSQGPISYLARGILRPSMASMEGLARGFGIEPETFAEYRLLMARRKLDPEVVGLEAALAELDRIEE